MCFEVRGGGIQWNGFCVRPDRMRKIVHDARGGHAGQPTRHHTTSVRTHIRSDIVDRKKQIFGARIVLGDLQRRNTRPAWPGSSKAARAERAFGERSVRE